MSGRKVALLRLRLPPLRDIEAGALYAAWREADGDWQTAHFSHLGAVSAHFSPARCEVCLHPGDISMTQVAVPPLKGKQLRLAAIGAVELLALLGPEQLIIGYGSRNEAGELPVAWSARAVVQQIKTALAAAGLRSEIILPPPAFLAAPEDSGQPAAVKIDNWLIQRSGQESGAVLPLPVGQKVGDDIDAVCCWNGEGWHWGLALSASGSADSASRWRRPLVAWSLAVALVWVGGLNLYAWQLAAQGEALKQQMAAQVKAAFPELPVVLNPLQQARQMRDARNSGDAANRTVDFPLLLNSAASLLTDSDGQVQWLHYHAGQLEIGWREGATLRRSELERVQAQARAHQLMATAQTQGISLRADSSAVKPPAAGQTP